MRWARIVLGGIATFVGFVIAALMLLFLAQPTSYHFERTRTIAAPPARVMAQLSDLHAFESWAPWTSLPGVTPTITYSPNATGLGAWVDRRDGESGARTTITALTSDRIELTSDTNGSLGRGHSTQTFTLREVPTGTEVTWALGSELHGLARFLWPFVNLEARVGPDLDRALSRLDQASR